MTRIGIVQLSDIHFHKGALSDYMQTQMTAIATAVASLRAGYGVTDVIVVISGDLAYSGQQSEYEHAVNLLDSIRTKATENFAPVIHFLMVPGNHDCDFQKDTTLRKTTLSSMHSLPDEDLVDPSIANTCTSVQDEFWTFASFYHTFTSGVGNLYSSASIGLADSRHKVVAHLLNTAWVSKVREEQGVMRYPVQLLTNTNEEKNASVVLAIMHHPTTWLMSSNSKALIKRLTATVDIIITGHEHQADSFGRIWHGGKLTFVEGGVISDSQNIENSNFNLLVIDPDEHKYDMYIYTWNPEAQAYLPRRELADYSYRNKSRKQGGYVIREDYKQSFLQELGIAITHPHKQTVLLRDLFVFPDFREFDLATNAASVETIFGHRIVGYITSKRKVLVTGSDQSGKTSLSKVLFEELINKDFIPLIINGKELTEKTDGGVRDIIEKTYNAQYDSPSYAVFMQDSVKRRAIIVDDYHKIRHRGTLRNRIVKILCEIAETIVILGSHEAMLDEFSAPAAENNILLDFSFCTILEFGMVRQSELVRRWYSLGRDAIGESSHAEREKQAALAERAIQTSLSRDFVPADPISILVMLYQIESQTKIDVSCSSYGHLFDVLVKTNLGVAKYDSADFNSRFTYLSELAFYMYERRNFRLDRSSQQEWQEYYRSTYRPPFNCEHLVDDLVDAQVLSSRDGELSFRYKYHYYYFVGQYFAAHIAEPEPRQQVARMCRRLYNEDSANIILFMCHFSKDKFILKTIIDTARTF